MTEQAVQAVQTAQTDQTDQSVTGDRAEAPAGRTLLLARAEVLWRRLIDRNVGQAFDGAFSGWGTERNAAIWARVPETQSKVILRMDALDPAVREEKLIRLLADVNELRALRSAVEVLDTGGLDASGFDGASELGVVRGWSDQTDQTDQPEHGTGPTGYQAVVPTDHSTEVARIMATRREEAAVAAAGGRVEAAARESAVKPIVLKVHTTSVESSAGRTVGMSAAQLRDLPDKCNKDNTAKGVRVDRIDAVLMELAVAHVTELLGQAQIRVAQVTRPAVVNAALAVVLRSAGVPGLVLSEEGEMLCEVLGSGGDLSRTATMDARLEVMGQSLGRLEKQSRLMAQRQVAAERSALMESMTSALVLAEQTRKIKLGMNPEVEMFDLTDPAVIALHEHLAEQARIEWERRVAAQGRPNSELARRRRTQEVEQARLDAAEQAQAQVER